MTAPTIAVEDCGVTVPAWSVRLAVGAVCAAIVPVLGADAVPGALLVVVGLLGAATVMSPGSAAPAALCAVAAVVSAVYGAAVGTGDALRPTVLALIFLVHLLHVGAGIAAVVPRGARLHLPALRRPLRRFAVVQAAVLALAAVAAVLPAGRNPALLEVLATLAVAALAVLAALLLRRH